MQGYKLSEGTYDSKNKTKDEMWDIFNWLFSSRSRNDASYKFIFFKAVIDCLDKKDRSGKISFDILFTEFTRISWNLVLKYGIAQKGEASDGRISSLERVLRAHYTAEDSFDELFDEERLRICKEVKAECKKYVVGALFGDTDGVIYSFSKKGEWIQMNPDVEEFIKSNIGIIENLNYFKWAQFYQMINKPDKEAWLKEIVDQDVTRKNENIYRTILALEFEMTSKTRIKLAELLIGTESGGVKEVDNSMLEKELFRDPANMKQYMADPILLLNYLKKEKGIR